MKRPTPARPIVLLGPQRREPRVRSVLEELGAEGPVAAVTAGWEELEEEIEELQAHLDRPVHHLRLWHRAEEAFEEDPDLYRILRERYDALRRLRSLYRLRLEYALAAVRRLQEQDPGDRLEDLLEAELESAFEEVRRLDREHLQRVEEVHREYDPRIRAAERPSLVRHRREIRGLLEESHALCLAGGHVAILLNRLRLFLDGFPDRLPLVAWSAGAMVLSERIVLFHDRPPQGPGNPEVLEPGLGLAPGLVLFPHARRRLILDEPLRVARLARRLQPACCLTLDRGSAVWLRGRAVQRQERVSVLQGDGSVLPAGTEEVKA